MKVISAILGILIAIGIAIGCYFVFKDSYSYEDDSGRLDLINEDYSKNMEKVFLILLVLNFNFLSEYHE